MTFDLPRAALVSAAVMLLSAGFALAQPAPSFNCAKAQTPAEKAICADTTLAKADADIAQRIKALGQALDSETAKALVQDQRSFIKLRDQIADQAASPAARTQALQGLFGARLGFLARIEPTPGDSLVGVWGNLEGEVTVTQTQDGTLTARINTADPVQGNWLCLAQGQGKMAQKVLDVAVQEGEPGERLTVSRVAQQPLMAIDFTRNGKAATASFCGLNGGVAGYYFKLRPLG